MTENNDKKVIQGNFQKRRIDPPPTPQSPQGLGHQERSNLVPFNERKRGKDLPAGHPLSKHNLELAQNWKAQHEKGVKNAPLLNKVSDFIAQNRARLYKEIIEHQKKKVNIILISEWKIGDQLEKQTALYDLAQSLDGTAKENIIEVAALLQTLMDELFGSPPSTIKVMLNQVLGIISLRV